VRHARPHGSASFPINHCTCQLIELTDNEAKVCRQLATGRAPDASPATAAFVAQLREQGSKDGSMPTRAAGFAQPTFSLLLKLFRPDMVRFGRPTISAHASEVATAGALSLSSSFAERNHRFFSSRYWNDITISQPMRQKPWIFHDRIHYASVHAE
jgi:hypothetical protein